MIYESDASSDHSYSHDEIERLYNRCSICFESKLDLCLENCRDQFCFECFQTYVHGVVQSSWGINVTPIKCPVCNDLLSRHEWSRYVARKIVDMYDKYNAPYKSFSRSCPDCNTDIVPCVFNHTSIQQLSKHITQLIDTIEKTCTNLASHSNHSDHIAIKRWIPIFKRIDINEKQLVSFYNRMMGDILLFENDHTKQSMFMINESRIAYKISTLFLNHPVKPDIWKHIQFAHIHFFPKIRCSACSVNVCLHCGHNIHYNQSCEENMRWMAQDNLLSPENRATLQWKLKHSRPCPSCSIMINRDEGCNKVDCLYCGHCFCWSCRLSWQEGCGFYRCSVMGEVYAYEDLPGDRVELGIPDIKNIQQRLSNNRSYS